MIVILITLILIILILNRLLTETGMICGFKNTTRYAKSADVCLCTNCYATGHWHRMYLYAILYGHYSRISFNMIVLTFRLVMFQMKDHLKWRLLINSWRISCFSLNGQKYSIMCVFCMLLACKLYIYTMKYSGLIPLFIMPCQQVTYTLWSILVSY